MEVEAAASTAGLETLPSEEVTEYAVDKVLDRRLKSGKAEFLIKWKGYSV